MILAPGVPNLMQTPLWIPTTRSVSSQRYSGVGCGIHEFDWCTQPCRRRVLT